MENLKNHQILKESPDIFHVKTTFPSLIFFIEIFKITETKCN